MTGDPRSPFLHPLEDDISRVDPWSGIKTLEKLRFQVWRKNLLASIP